MAEREQKTGKKAPASPPAVLISQTYRLPQTLVARLMRVSLERKLAREKPWTQQDIVAEAVEAWLDSHTNS